MPDEKDQEKMVERLSQGQFSLRDLYEQLKNMMKMGRLTGVLVFLVRRIIF